MSDDVTSFLQALRTSNLGSMERAVALLWWRSQQERLGEVSIRQLADEIERAGYPKQNVSRLKNALMRDRRVRKAGSGCLCIDIRHNDELWEQYGIFLNRKPIRISNSLIPRELSGERRGYIERVVDQINLSYDYGLFDCCAVMCRRLLETLIIELYERNGRATDLQNSHGQFKMFSDLLNQLLGDRRVHLSRNAASGLKVLKRLGDQSAHNRRYNARRSDIDRVRDDLRLVVEELLNVATRFVDYPLAQHHA